MLMGQQEVETRVQWNGRQMFLMKGRQMKHSCFFSVSGLSPAFLFPGPSVYNPAKLGSFLPWAFLFTASSSSFIISAVVVFFGLFFFGLRALSFLSAGISTGSSFLSFSPFAGGGEAGLSLAGFGGGDGLSGDPALLGGAAFSVACFVAAAAGGAFAVVAVGGALDVVAAGGAFVARGGAA